MNKQAQASLLNELLDIVAESINEPLSIVERGMSWGSNDRILMLPEPAAHLFLSFVGKLARQPPWSERVSEDYIQEHLVPILRTAREGEAEVAGVIFDELVREVENYSVERTVYIPIKGVSLSVDPLQVGQVVMQEVDDSVIDELGRLLEPTHTNPDDRGRDRESVEGCQDTFAKKLRGKVCAEFRTVAEPTRAKERAEEETRRTLELITYANAALHPFDRQADAVAGLDGDLPAVGPWIAMASHGEFHHFLSRTPTSWPIPLTPAVLEQFEDVGFWALSDLLARPANQLTQLDQALLRAVHWFSASQAQAEHENRLLNLITCLEALVGPKDGAPISSSVAEGVALIITEGYENRRRVKKFLGEMYGARSGISHGGDKVVAESDVAQLRWITSTLITRLIRWKDGLRTKDELLKWLERTRLSGEPVDPPTVAKPRTLRELREERGWTQEELARRVGRISVSAEEVDCWERWSPPPPAPELRLFADALNIIPTDIALPLRERWVNVRNHLFHLTAHREAPGRWIARVIGYDPTDVVEWPRRAVDPTHPDIDSPSIIVTGRWEATGFTAERALATLTDRIVSTMELTLASP